MFPVAAGCYLWSSNELADEVHKLCFQRDDISHICNTIKKLLIVNSILIPEYSQYHELFSGAKAFVYYVTCVMTIPSMFSIVLQFYVFKMYPQRLTHGITMWME